MLDTLKVAFDASAPTTLRRLLTEHEALFREAAPEAADVVLFGTDEIAALDRSALLRAFPDKAVCVTESDIPTFRLPGLYAANEAAWFTTRRTETISYFLSEIDRPNPEVRRRVGQRVEKRWLYSFMGGANCWPRKRLIARVAPKADTVIEATHSYNHWSEDEALAAQRHAQRVRYAEVMAASKFVLCPRGCGLSSYRLFESMMLGVAPVIISDRWRPIAGIDWDFALFVRERHIGEIDAILRRHEGEWAERGAAAAAAYAAHLGPSVIATTVHAALIRVLRDRSALRESLVAPLLRFRSARREAYWRAYAVGKRLLLAGFSVTGIACPIPLVRPAEEQLGQMRGKP